MVTGAINAAITVSSNALPMMRSPPPHCRRNAGCTSVAMQPITLGASSTVIVK
jgi:hypothetical protein